MKRIFILASLLITGISYSYSFCGFYVAKADATLFNTTSQVILVRDGEKTTLTMSSDFKGDVNDFAMVVPVPVVLKRDNIRTVNSLIFQTMDNYSSPRLVEYWDADPCAPRYDEVLTMSGVTMKNMSVMDMVAEESLDNEKYHVTIEAQYQVDEYDILILSAEESNGLEMWLTDNGYKIPDGAQEVLEPYIKSGMKFFVVKVNTDELKKKGTEFLSPLQINFNSPKFMLPIRLGMANAKGTQDMIVYALTKNGRVETTNYRTVKLPTGNLVPEFVKEVFGQFYVDTYRKFRNQSGHNNVYLEYAWDISGYVTTFCDPCNGPPPVLQDLANAGVDWVQSYHYGYEGNVFFTRLHITYDRKNFPQDLIFQETPNKENYQARYVITHPAYSDFKCDEARTYKDGLYQRRSKELMELASLTGWEMSPYVGYVSTFYNYQLNSNPWENMKVVDPIIEDPKDPIEVIDSSTLEQIDSSLVNQEQYNEPYIENPKEKKSQWKWFALFGGALAAVVTVILVSKGGGNGNAPL